MDSLFWKNRRVFITGHTGFKGSWLTFWLHQMGAYVTGYALPPDAEPSLFGVLGLENKVINHFSDIRDYQKLELAINAFEPDVIIHMAAQPLVRESYNNPVETLEVNITGTLNLLQAAREVSSVKSIVNVTTDKCYDNKEQIWSYRETDPLGGHDPYSASKACSELITNSYYKSFYEHNHLLSGIASARAGNVIGGGDWSADRIITDITKSQETGKPIELRSPNATRPWQHVLEPLYGYILLAQRLFESKSDFSSSWNFGPGSRGQYSVSELLKVYSELSDKPVLWRNSDTETPHEAELLSLDITKSRRFLNWHPKLNFRQALKLTEDWYRAFNANENMIEITKKQITYYQEL